GGGFAPHRLGGKTQGGQVFPQPPRDRAEPNDRKMLDRIEACDPLRRHLAASDPDKTHLSGGALPQRPYQRGAEPITRLLGGDEKHIDDFGGARGARWCGHRSAVWSRTPKTNSPSRAAVAPSRSGSATIVLPATTAIPASPARAAPPTVCGPIEGKSMRRSWPRFAALTNTPRPEDAAMRPL